MLPNGRLWPARTQNTIIAARTREIMGAAAGPAARRIQGRRHILWFCRSRRLQAAGSETGYLPITGAELDCLGAQGFLRSQCPVGDLDRADHVEIADRNSKRPIGSDRLCCADRDRRRLEQAIQRQEDPHNTPWILRFERGTGCCVKFERSNPDARRRLATARCASLKKQIESRNIPALKKAMASLCRQSFAYMPRNENRYIPKLFRYLMCR